MTSSPIFDVFAPVLMTSYDSVQLDMLIWFDLPIFIILPRFTSNGAFLSSYGPTPWSREFLNSRFHASSDPGPVHFVWWYEVMGTWYWGWPYTLLFSLQLPVLSLDTRIALPVLYLLYCQVCGIHSRSRFFLRRPCLVLSRKFPKAVNFFDLFELKRYLGCRAGDCQPRYQHHINAPFEIKHNRIIEMGRLNHIMLNWVIGRHQYGSNDVINGWWRHQQ